MHTLRRATEADVEFLTEVVVTATKHLGRWPADMSAADEAAWREGFADWTREQVRDEVAGSTTSVVEVDGVPVGRHRVVREDDRVELAGIQLLPEHQGRGLGAAVVRDVVEEAERRGVPALLSVEKDNPRARALYERHGFVLVGEDDREHHLVRNPGGSDAERG